MWTLAQIIGRSMYTAQNTETRVMGVELQCMSRADRTRRYSGFRYSYPQYGLLGFIELLQKVSIEHRINNVYQFDRSVKQTSGGRDSPGHFYHRVHQQARQYWTLRSTWFCRTIGTRFFSSIGSLAKSKRDKHDLLVFSQGAR